MPTPVRRGVSGLAEVEAALAAGVPVAAAFVGAGALRDASVAAAVERLRRSGAAVHVAGSGVLRRFGRDADAPAIVAVIGPPVRASLTELLSRGGAVWLLAGVSYAANVGAAIRTAEVSGADGAIVGVALTAAPRRTALRASMRADRVMPVLFEPVETVLDAAARAGVRVVGLEECGARTVGEADLTGPLVLVAGGERSGIPRPILARCGEVVRVPSAGFIPSYNVQAAVAAASAERLRQLRG